MNRHNLNRIIDDYEKKLLLYSSNNSKELTSLNENYYEVLADIIINENNLPFEYLINRLENYFKHNIDIKEHKLNFKHSDYSLLGSYVYKKLFDKFNINAFGKYIEIIEENISSEIYSWLSIDFDNSIIRDNFLNASTEYIITNQNRVWKEDFENIDYERYSWLKKVDNIPTSFRTNEDLYFWLKENDYYENLMMIGNPIVKNLLHQIINWETYNTNLVEENRIIKLLKECKNDYITIGEILTGNNIKLNCYLLKNNEYSTFAFCNLFMLDRLNIDESYAKQFLELLSQQFLDIIFSHLKNLFYQNDLVNKIYYILNFICDKYVNYYYRTNSYGLLYTFELFLKKLLESEIKTSNYQKEEIFSIVIKDLIEKQILELEEKESFDKKNYFLLSYYLKGIGRLIKVKNFDALNYQEKISNSILDNLKKSLSNITNDKRVYIDFPFLENIDFSLFFLSSNNKDDVWLKIFDLESVIKGLNSTNVYIFKQLSKFYLKILFQIFKKTQNIKVEKCINEIIIKLGFKVDFSIIKFDDNFEILNEYLELLNLFTKEHFEAFVNQICESYELSILLQLLSSSILEERKEFIKKKLNRMIQEEIDADKLSYNDLKIGILYALDNNFLILANKLEEIYKKRFESSGSNSFMKKFQNEFNEVVCKKDLLEILDNKDLKIKEKFEKLNNYKIPIDNKTVFLTESRYSECENFKEFIRALIFFDNKEYDKAYRILKVLCEKELTSNYLINMVNSYFNLYKEDENKVVKFEYILNIFEEKHKLFQPYIKSIYEYQVLIYGYTITKNISKLSQLIKDMPKQYDLDFDIFKYKYEFFKENSQEFIAKKYLGEFKKFYENNVNILKKVQELEEELNSHTRMEMENNFDVRISFDSLTLSEKEAKKYWNQIKDMDLDKQSQIFSNKLDSEEFIIYIMEQISSELLERKVNILRNIKNNITIEIENIINDWVSSLLKQRMNFLDWKVLAESRGGENLNGNVGERDIIVYNKNGDKLFLFEAFRLFGCDTTTIKTHMNKLDGYNADGSKLMIVIMVYTYYNNFVELCSSYESYLKTFNYNGFKKIGIIKEHCFENIETTPTKIKLLKEVRIQNEKEVAIYHYLLDFYSKKE
ncbi:hypothetical protein Abu_1135 [Aliarcobacter butzleri RM4018]|uniref:Uncharacterized protein n=1 Tax=Aliarcobacter butzleri (strain RM4018) TaxID=367737 RepID=A8ETX1_ALIB4|nr:hypothetical protein [Aliarcobacter butzleri]ABV67395.1 hypothetical protein Abu_1135 [Aliarcobacter butzleri RM4018]GGT73113.1 hypothetical protein GCM10007985_06400 [Aliarcobacter butzleri]SNV28416.1 Uncharacterised protein [Aliarcobacter butzleri]